MLQYLFTRPVPVAELDAELRAFVREVSRAEFDTVAKMLITLAPTKEGKQFNFVCGSSDAPITRIIYESRLAKPKPKPQ